MRLVWLLVVAMCAACDGISIGDPGLDPPATRRCSEERFVVLRDLSLPSPGFANSPNALLEAARRMYGGTLELSDGRKVPVKVAMTLDESSVRAIYRLDSQEHSCPHWLTANVRFVIDAGSTLSGMATGAISTGDQYGDPKTQISTVLIPLENFDTTLSAPTFKGEVSYGPALSFSFTLEDDDTWQADWSFAAVVAAKQSGFPGTETQFKALGKAELNATDELDAGRGDAGGTTGDAGNP